MDFDFSTETITPDNTGNITITGSSLIIPTGDSSSRPSSPIAGMVRFNTDDNTIEFYDTLISSWHKSSNVPIKSAWSWGSNSAGQLGLSDNSHRSNPTQIGSLTNWKQMICNSTFAAGLDENGRLWTWGSNGGGQLGLGDIISRSSPTQVGSLTDWVSIAVTGYCMHAIKKDGTLWSWGGNSDGQLGVGDITSRSSPVQVGSLTDWKYVDGNYKQSVAIKKDGTMWTWGYNNVGQLGIGDAINRSSPTQVGSLTDWAYAQVGLLHMAAIKKDGTLWVWGDNYLGAFGNQTIIGSQSPIQFGTSSNWTAVNCSNAATFAVNSNGELWATGSNSNGQLGVGDTIHRSSPVQVGSLTRWVDVVGDNGGIFGLQSDGTLWAWGNNANGRLGVGDTIHRSSPTQVGSLTTWIPHPKLVSAGPNFAGGLQSTARIIDVFQGGTGLNRVGYSGQILGMSADNISLEYKTLKAGNGMSITHSQGGITFSSTFDSTTAAPHENGYDNKADSTISFVDGTRTFTIAPVSTSFSFWSGGVKFIKTTAQTVTLTDTTGTWYIYFDTTGTLQATQTFSDLIITLYAFTAQVYWNATSGTHLFFGDERHGCVMDSRTHLYLHKTRHATFDTGLALTGITAEQSGNTNSDAQFGVVNGTIWDEDLKHDIIDGSPQTLTNPAQIPVYYRYGTTEWRKYSSSFPLIYGGISGVGTRLNYNENVSGTWQLTEVATANCALVHYYATNSVETPIIGICGQTEYITVLDARNGAETELAALQLGLFITLEFVPIGTVIYQTSNTYSNTPKTRIRSTTTGENYIDWRATNVTTLGSNGTTWGTISGTLSNQSDLMTYLDTLVPPQAGNSGKYLTTNGSTTSWGTISGGGTVTSVAVSGGTTGLTTSGGPITGSGTITLAGTLATTNGGTGLTSIGTSLQYLRTNTGATALEWATLPTFGTVTSVNASGGTTGLSFSGGPITGSGTLTLSGTLIAANGGTGQTTYAVGDTLYSGATNTLTKLSGNITTTKQFLSQTGNGSVSAAPSWSTVSKSDVGLGSVENTALSTWAGSTNITTLGTIGTGTWNATNISISKGGTGLSTTPTNGQLLIGNGTNYTLAGLTQGTGITVTNGSGSITVTNAGVTSIAGTTDQITASASTGSVTLSLPSNIVAPGSIQVTTTLNQTQSTAVTAAGTDPATATAISSRYNIVTTVASGTGVRLPIPTTPFGTEIFVSNRGANTLTIYPNSGAAIANGAANAGILLPTGQETTLVCTSATQWYTTEPILAAGTNITLTPSAGVLTIAASGGGGSPGGSNTQVQYNNAGAFAGATNVTIDNNDIVLLENTSPVTPLAGVKLFGRELASRMLPAIVGPSGMDACMQPSVWRQKVAWWNPPGNATTVPGVLGMAAPTALGTATARTVATTNLMSRTRRLGYVSSGTAGNFAGHYNTAAQYTTGTGSGLGGFFYSCRFAASDAATVSGARQFVGLSSSTAAPTNVQPNTITNCIGVAQISTDATQLYIVYGGSVAQTNIALGTNFPTITAAGATNGVVYDLTLFSPPNQNAVVYYRLERVGTAFVAEGTLSGTPGTTTPANTTLLAHRAWRCNNATALAVGLDIINVYTETDY